jgi:hypothetical protein
MKLILFVILSFTILFAKECYTKKGIKKVCFKRFYAVKELKKPVKFKEHYSSKKGYIYTFNDKLKITIKYSGAILYILDNFEVEYDDRINKNTHILQVINHHELFTIISNLNKQDSVISARPVLKRVYRKGYKKASLNTAKGRTTIGKEKSVYENPNATQ